MENRTVSPSTSVYSENSCDRPQDLRVIKKETSPTLAQPDGTEAAVLVAPTRRVGSAFTPVQPRGAPLTTPLQAPPCCDVIAAAAGGGVASSPGSVANDASSASSSPLKQMQTIANLLLPKHSHQRPLRAVLPPITQVSPAVISYKIQPYSLRHFVSVRGNAVASVRQLVSPFVSTLSSEPTDR